jgi:hypothetical protein
MIAAVEGLFDVPPQQAFPKLVPAGSKRFSGQASRPAHSGTVSSTTALFPCERLYLKTHQAGSANRLADAKRWLGLFEQPVGCG